MTLKGRTVFEHDYGYPQHDHLHCQKCDRLIEFHSDELAAIRAAVGRENKFHVTGHRFIITGVCSKCQGSRRPVRRLDLI
jgi:Fur family ferric uptake transcriptional regulator